MGSFYISLIRLLDRFDVETHRVIFYNKNKRVCEFLQCHVLGTNHSLNSREEGDL